MKIKVLFVLIVLGAMTFHKSVGQEFRRINTSNGLSNNTVLSILQDEQGYIWFGTDDGLNKYNGLTFEIFKPDTRSNDALSHAIVKALFLDSEGKIWIGTDGGGLCLFDPKLETFQSFYHNPKDPNTISHNNVSAITEDRNHTIWVGTYGGGLNKYDRETHQFSVYKNKASDPFSLSSNFINCLLTDLDDNLWIGTWGRGLNRMDKTKEQFVAFLHDDISESSLSNNTVNCLYEDSHHQLWIGTWGGGMDLFQSKIGIFKHYLRQKEPTMSHPIVRSITGEPNGILWVTTFGGGVLRFDPASETYSNYVHQSNNEKSLSNNSTWAVYRSLDNKIWVGTIDGGINLLDLNPDKFHTIPRKNDEKTHITALASTRTSELWIGTKDDGIQVLNADFELQKVWKKIPKVNSLVDNAISTVLEDKFGYIWIGTQNGLSQFNPATNRFKNYQQTPNTYKCLSFNVITDVFEDHLGTIWISTWGGGLNRYNRQTDDFDYYLQLKKVKVNFYVDMTGIPIAKEGIHIAGSMNGWNPSKDQLKLIKDDIYGVEMELYTVGYEYKFLNGNRWGTEETIPISCAIHDNRIIYPGDQDISLDAVLFGKGCNQVASEPLSITLSEEDQVLSSNHVYDVFEDRQGTLWVGTNNGINVLDRSTNSFDKIQQVRGDTTSLSDNHVSCFMEDKEGTLWIGTLGGGLNRFDTKTKTFTSYDEKNGLGNNNVRAILEDDQGKIWITTNSGLSRFDSKINKFRNFDQSDGLQELSFHSSAALKMKNQTFLLGGDNGLIQFNTMDLQDNQPPPQVLLTQLFLANQKVKVGQSYNGQVILSQSLESTKQLVLSHEENVFSIHFATIDFSSNSKSQYAYKLEGFDKQWHIFNDQNKIATYTNLNAGQYTFLVKASNSDGLWSEKPRHLKIIITPPFYESFWFRMIGVLILISLVYLWYKTRVYNRRKALEKESLISEKKIIELEKNCLEQEIEHKNKELGSIAMQMMNKSKMIKEQVTRLKWIMRSTDSSTKNKLSQLVTKLNKELDLDKDWDYFELHFDKIYQDFITKLKQEYPQMPASDIRLAAYIRMGLSTKEITELMDVSVRGVESRRYRLRKTFELNAGENLSDFIFKI